MESGAVQPSPSISTRLHRDIGSSIFGANIAGYAAARIGYPPELYEALRQRCGNAKSLVEIGPGTGLATFDLISTIQPDLYVGVEPDGHLGEHLTGLLGKAGAGTATEVVIGRFEDFTSDKRFDLACCAAAFHWLDPEQAFRKLRQILRPGGTLAIWWNCYRQKGIGDAFADRVDPLLSRITLAPSEIEGGHYSLASEFHRQAITGNGFTDFEPHLFRRERSLTTDEVVTLYASYSYIRALPVAKRYELLARISDLAENEFAGKVPNITLTALYMASAPPAAQ